MHQISPQDLVVGGITLAFGLYIIWELYKLWKNSRNPESPFGTRGFWLSTVAVVAFGVLWLCLSLIVVLMLFVFFA